MGREEEELEGQRSHEKEEPRSRNKRERRRGVSRKTERVKRRVELSFEMGAIRGVTISSVSVGVREVMNRTTKKFGRDIIGVWTLFCTVKQDRKKKRDR